MKKPELPDNIPSITPGTTPHANFERIKTAFGAENESALLQDEICANSDTRLDKVDFGDIPDEHLKIR